MADTRHTRTIAWGQVSMLGLLLILLIGFSADLNPLLVSLSFGLLVVFHLASDIYLRERPYPSGWHASLHLGCYLLLCAVLLWATTRPEEESLFWFVSLLPVVMAASRLSLTSTTLVAGAAGLIYFLTLPEGFILAGDFWEELPEFVLIAATYLFVGFLVQTLSSQSREQLLRQQELNQELMDQKETLTRTLNQLASAEQQLRRRDRLAALGEMSAGMAHEIRNPLGIISSTVQLLNERGGQGGTLPHEMLGIIQEETGRLNRLISEFLVFGRDTRPETQPCDLARLIGKFIEGFRPHAERKGITVTVDLQAAPTVPADLGMLQQVLLNLTLNALQASPQGAEIRLELQESDGDAIISVLDHGDGIPPEMAEKIFTPFFTTRDEGTGLGLANAHKLVEAQGGELNFTSEPGKGSVFTIRLPGATT